MYCPKCGSSIPDESIFCLKCGTNIPKEMNYCLPASKMIHLVCPSCNGNLDIEKGKKIHSCPYCGSKTFLDDGNRTITKNINYTRRDIDEARINEAKYQYEREVEQHKFELEQQKERNRDINLSFMPIYIILIIIIIYLFN